MPLSTRAAAASVVDQVLARGRTLDRALAGQINASRPSRDIAQIKALAFGTLRWHHRHRLIIARLLNKPLRAGDTVLEALLSVGLFQLIYPRQPQYAAVAATVEASRELKRGRAAGLINAALRRFQREREELLSSALEQEQGRFAHPQWFIDRLRNDWPAHWQGILESALAHPPLWIRVNSRRISRDDYLRRLRKEADIVAHSLQGFSDALRLDKSLTVTELPGFTEGLVSVQDAASQLAAELLAPEPGMRVLDACAAPGGKTGHLMERARGQIQLVAVEIDRARTRLLQENLQRLGHEVQIITEDALVPDNWWNGELFDRILVDAPCSATGVIRRHPDIKFLRRCEDIPKLAQRQNELLESLWPVVKPGGRILYATCSVLQQENTAVVSDFLGRHSDAIEIKPLRGGVLDTVKILPGPGYQLLPGAADTDGFYYALMQRQA